MSKSRPLEHTDRPDMSLTLVVATLNRSRTFGLLSRVTRLPE
jgi:hypothetical protein